MVEIYTYALLPPRGRRFFMTIEGRVGLAKHPVRAGDWVVALFGGEYSFLLRPVAFPANNENTSDLPGARRRCRMVALASILAIMNGKATRAPREAGEESEVFEIW